MARRNSPRKGAATQYQRLAIVDYAGHPFQAQLSRMLAVSGKRVDHFYSRSVASGQGNLEVGVDDPEGLAFHGVQIDARVTRSLAGRRAVQEFKWGRVCISEVNARRPQVVLAANLPFIVQVLFAVRFGRRLILWQQDIHSHVIASVISRRSARMGRYVLNVTARVEGWTARRARGVICISSAFEATLDRWRVPASGRVVIPNWAPIDELPILPEQHLLHDILGLRAEHRVVLYSGTLGYKHDPECLVAVAKALQRTDDEARLVVVSEGLGRDLLAQRLADDPSLPLVLADYQPYDLLPGIMASAKVLLVILESDAAEFSVPSKLLTYLCAGRPIVGYLPRQNDAFTTLHTSGAGIAVDSAESAEVFAAAVIECLNLNADSNVGAAGRAYAERAFDSVAIVEKFEGALARFDARV
jgi:colanic acid biosynthesis glycosyl transferase WcaI